MSNGYAACNPEFDIIRHYGWESTPTPTWVRVSHRTIPSEMCTVPMNSPDSASGVVVGKVPETIIIDDTDDEASVFTALLPFDVTRRPIFIANEEFQELYSYSYNHEEFQELYCYSYNHSPLRWKINENNIKSNLRDSVPIWGSSASHSLHAPATQAICKYATDPTYKYDSAWPGCSEFLKGWDWNPEWGSLNNQFLHAMIGKLFDRDDVSVDTQTVVSFENQALWAVHIVLAYKVYPGFWGRVLGLLYMSLANLLALACVLSSLNSPIIRRGSIE